MKSHRIPKFLTKPWETENGTFKFFSFQKQQIFEASANSFFAEEGIFTPGYEQFWNTQVETPLADFLNGYDKRHTAQKFNEVRNFKHIKAMHLLLISIMERSSRWNGKTSLDFPKQDFEYSIWLWHKKKNIVILNTPFNEHRLMFPEIGFFPIIFFTQKGLPLLLWVFLYWEIKF